MTILEEALVGCEEAAEELFWQYTPIVFNLMRKYYVRDFDRDDWLQEGRIAFYLSLEKFNENAKTSLGVYFKHNFENRIRSHLRKQAAYKRRAYADAVSLEQKIEEDGPDFLSEYSQLTTQLDDQLAIVDELASLEKILSKYEQYVFARYLKGRDLAEIAAENDDSYDKAKMALCRIRKKLNYHLKTIY